MELLSPILKALRDKYNYKFHNAIGSGMSGTVYDIGNNRVLKITNDKEEAYAANKIKSKNFKNVYKVFKVFTFKKQHFSKFYIECERLIPIRMNEDFEEFYNYIIQNQDADFKANLHMVDEVIKNSNNPEEFSELFSNKNDYEKDFLCWHFGDNAYNFEIELMKMNIKLVRMNNQFNDLINGINELKSIGVNFYDIHMKNIMRDDSNNYKFVDITSFQKSEIEIFENKNFITQSKKVRYAVTDKQKEKGLRGIELDDWSGMMIFTDVKEGDTFVGKDCLFDIRIAFLNQSNVVISVETIEKGTGVVTAPPDTVKAIETASNDEYKIIPNSKFIIPASKFHFPNLRNEA